MTKTDSQNTDLPKWVRILAVLVIPVILALIAVIPNWKSSPTRAEPTEDMECTEAFTIVGRAYYQDGTSLITNTPISLIDLTHNQEVTASDGTFSFEQVKLNCEREFLQIGLEIDGKLITARRRFDLSDGQSLIDLNQVIFPIKKKDEFISSPVEDREKGKLPSPKSVAPLEKKEVILKYPTEIKNPEILFGNEEIEMVRYGITNCKLLVPDGVHRITLMVQNEKWVATFTNKQSVITPEQFTKTQ